MPGKRIIPSVEGRNRLEVEGYRVTHSAWLQRQYKLRILFMDTAGVYRSGSQQSA